MVGLGNPGARYLRTRHNAGFMAIDELAARTRAAGRLSGEAWIAETTLAGEPALLVKPQSYMNLSGEPVARLLGETRRVPGRPGRDRGRRGAAARAAPRARRGQRRRPQRPRLARSQALGTEAFARVRIGVGVEPVPGRTSRTSCSPTSCRRRSRTCGEVIGLAADAVSCLVQEGAAVAMNRFNGPSD